MLVSREKECTPCFSHKGNGENDVTRNIEKDKTEKYHIKRSTKAMMF